MEGIKKTKTKKKPQNPDSNGYYLIGNTAYFKDVFITHEGLNLTLLVKKKAGRVVLVHFINMQRASGSGHVINKKNLSVAIRVIKKMVNRFRKVFKN